MRRNTPKRAKHNRGAEHSRKAYRKEYWKCQFPGCDKLGKDLHEMARGPGRRDSLAVWAGLLHLCRKHHDVVQIMPPVAQAGIKKLSRSAYDLELFNSLRGRAACAITEAEVNDWIMKGKLSP